MTSGNTIKFVQAGGAITVIAAIIVAFVTSCDSGSWFQCLTRNERSSSPVYILSGRFEGAWQSTGIQEGAPVDFAADVSRLQFSILDNTGLLSPDADAVVCENERVASGILRWQGKSWPFVMDTGLGDHWGAWVRSEAVEQICGCARADHQDIMLLHMLCYPNNPERDILMITLNIHSRVVVIGYEREPA